MKFRPIKLTHVFMYYFYFNYLVNLPFSLFTAPKYTTEQVRYFCIIDNYLQTFILFSKNSFVKVQKIRTLAALCFCAFK